MNKKIVLMVALMFLIIAVSAVSAEDVNQTQDNLETSDCDAISADEPASKSFTDLSNDINSSDSELDIKSDYKFNGSTDKGLVNGIDINLKEKKFTINGNNHVIDADNRSGIFRFSDGEVFITNLKIANANKSSIVLHDCILHTVNVTFENNYDAEEGAAVYASDSDFYSNHDRFINNYAPQGASIYAMDSIIDINDSTFIYDSPIRWSLIFAYESITTINNTVFANMTSRYATAVYSENQKLSVFNSKFINLFANATAGAIGCKGTDSMTIDGCSFINVTSSKNAGAVYADVNKNDYHPNWTVTISDSVFEDCSSNFGGAYIQLGGALNLIKSNFTNSTAEYMGGAIYLSNTTALIAKSKFQKSTARYNYGGALYIDDSDVIVNRCDFTQSKAGTYGDAIYMNDCRYDIKNSQFSMGYEQTIASFYDLEGSALSNNELNGGEVLLNQTKRFNTIVQYEGKEIILNPTVIVDANASSPRFDLRDYNVGENLTLAGVVKDQGNNGACWAFGATGALESAFLKATGILLDISENNIQGAATRYSEYGTTYIFEGGFANSALGLFLSWLGVISQESDSYDELGKVSIASFEYGGSYHIQDAVIIPQRQNAFDNAKFKDALVNYGGLTVHLYGASADNDYYNPTTHAQYYNDTGYGNHFVTLVGWDDNYPKENFCITPPGNGAWICKNSWGSEWGENGYFYVSYYDTTFAMSSPSVGYIINNTENYTTAYQYDIGRLDRYYQNGENLLTFVNTYEALGNELITAVGTYFENPNEEYTVIISVDGMPVYAQSGKSTHGGFETIRLSKQIAVNAGHKFSVGIHAKAVPLIYSSRIHFESGKSIVYHDATTEEDLGKIGMTASLKAYTVANPNPQESSSQYYTKNNLTIYSTAEGKEISIYKSTEKLGTANVTGGKASFGLALDLGIYVLITHYDEGDVIEGLEIFSSIEAPQSIKIGYNTELSIDATFYDADGIELFNRDIPLKLDGETFNGIIENNKGILYLTLNDLSIGKHTLVLQNPETHEESVISITVVSRFSGNSDVNMYYGDGSLFKVCVYDDYGNPVGANEMVTIKLNKATYKVKTDSKGYAILKIPDKVKPGTYQLTATYAGQTVKNTVKVKQVLKLAKVKVKKSAKKLVIKATLKAKKPIKGKKLTFKFKGKKYTAKTNRKGVAKITIKKSVLKKLKKGKKVTYQVTYLKNTVKRTVKVKK